MPFFGSSSMCTNTASAISRPAVILAPCHSYQRAIPDPHAVPHQLDHLALLHSCVNVQHGPVKHRRDSSSSSSTG